MNEPRRWLENQSPETVELRRLLEVAEKPRPMSAAERTQVVERIEALENRSSLPMHRVLPDFSIVIQWLGDLWNVIRPVKRVKHRPRMFVLVVVAMVMQSFAALAAPTVLHWWTEVTSRDFAVKRAHKNASIQWSSHGRILREKHASPHVAEVIPSANVPMAETPSVVAPQVTKAKSTKREVVAPVGTDMQKGPAIAPSGGSAESATPQALNSDKRIAAELALINEARASVGSNPSGTLALLARHEREFPAGPTSLTRELLYVETLQKVGRISEARARAKGNLEWARGRSSEGKWQQVLDSLQ
jgi:hypothetical protein